MRIIGQVNGLDTITDEPTTNRIIKSTAVIGGSSVINVIFQIIRAKAIAVLLGPSGLGLIGIFNTVIRLASMLSGMGISTSGVRQIAVAAKEHDEQSLARATVSLRRTALTLGFLGAVLLFLLRGSISQITFGSEAYGNALGWLAFAVFLTVVANSQATVIRGVRRIGDLARVTVYGVAAGTLMGLPILYWRRERGVVFYLLMVTVATFVVSWWYARKVGVAPASPGWRASMSDARSLIGLGVAFMAGGLITLGSTYVVKSLVIRFLGLGEVGLFEAASRLSNVYVGFILGAMGADFFPHLSEMAHDPIRSNALINEQVRIGALLAVPGILGVFAVGGWVLELLYSTEFTPAFVLLRWLVLGTFLRVISWPLGYLILAKGKGKLFFFTELGANVVYIGLSYWGIRTLGLVGVGVAFFFLYLFYTGLMTIVALRLNSFRWGTENLRLWIWMIPTVVAGFAISFITPTWLAASLGLAVALVVGVYSTWLLYNLLGAKTVQRYWWYFLKKRWM